LTSPAPSGASGPAADPVAGLPKAPGLTFIIAQASRVIVASRFATASRVSRALLTALVLLIAPAFIAGPPAGAAEALAAPEIPVVRPEVDRTVERPEGLFTQGLCFYDGSLFESTGRYGSGAVYRWPHPGRTLELRTPLAKTDLPDALFGEGLAVADGKLWVMSWREGVVLRLDPATLEIEETLFQPGEAWGLAAAGEVLWLSDGSSELSTRKAADFGEGPVKSLTVRDQAGPVKLLNELELDPATGLILANIWETTLVAAIDPADGRVVYYLDLSKIERDERARSKPPAEAVANGLAIDEEGRLWVTGKYWTRLYRLAYDPPVPAGSDRTGPR
jgi:glutaminyl-peptide cyclotransferase